MSNLLESLNPAQLAAVTLPHQHALILAGAGSGKTKVLTTRMAWLMQTGQTRPANILAVTFTNKAAKSIMMRLSGLLPINPRQMWVGTFHGLCHRFLRTHAAAVNLPATFQILDISDQQAAIKRLMKGLNIDDEKFPPRQIQYFINGAKDNGLRPKDVQVNDPFGRQALELYYAYEEQCQREGVVDFAELLLRSYELLSRDTALRQHYQQRFQHVLVDEFQDTNTLQYAWLKLLVGEHDSATAMFAVGDDDQSIYAFRGAKVGNMQSFQRDYKVQQLIRLEENYRSYGHILNAANALIAHNEGRLGKNLWTARGDGEPIRMYEAETDYQEAQWVSEEIKALIHDGLSRSEIAILYRSNAQSRAMEQALFAAGLPYRVYGGLRFFERQEIKHALAYLRLTLNRHDDMSFIRVVNFPTRGIGARSLEQLQDIAQARQISLFDSMVYMTGRAASALTGFGALIQQMQTILPELTLPDQIHYVLDHSGLYQHYEQEKEGQERLDNLNELINAADTFLRESQNNDPINQPDGISTFDDPFADDPLVAFLSHAALEAGDQQASTQEAIQLMTIHAAKGLEFDAVFITGLEEGLFPHDNAQHDEKGLEEERRLMYVAITRARQRLYLSCSQSRMLHGQTRFQPQSRFIAELPETSLKWLTPRRKLHYSHGNLGTQGTHWQRNRSNTTPHYREKSVTSPPPKQGTTKAGWVIGQQVTHAKFGKGVIVNFEGQAEDIRAQINFGAQGLKWLALNIAKLETIS
jgi:DNA helicase-2/ATP-dependent DNA helicase PcrA